MSETVKTDDVLHDQIMAVIAPDGAVLYSAMGHDPFSVNAEWPRKSRVVPMPIPSTLAAEVNRLRDALAASQAETADWKANAQRENAALVQAQQRIAELEQGREDVRRVEAYLGETDDSYVGRYAPTFPLHLQIANGGKSDEVVAEADSLPALGRMLKEGE